jgi:hypothetical protein
VILGSIRATEGRSEWIPKDPRWRRVFESGDGFDVYELGR